jgi:hypothetical protein
MRVAEFIANPDDLSRDRRAKLRMIDVLQGEVWRIRRGRRAPGDSMSMQALAKPGW